jgi:predicted site-specific integrase-resolvase
MHLLNSSEAAEILRIKPQTLAVWRQRGDGPRFRKVGSAVRYHPADISDFIERAARRSTSDEGGDAER